MTTLWHDEMIDDGWKRRTEGVGAIVLRRHPEHERRAVEATRARWGREVDVRVTQ